MAKSISVATLPLRPPSGTGRKRNLGRSVLLVPLPGGKQNFGRMKNPGAPSRGWFTR
jgi:hypothetical protein